MKFHKIKGSKDPKGHYSPAVSYNGFMFISGQVPVNPYNQEIYKGGIKEQLSGILTNLKRLLEDNNSSLHDVIKVNIYISNSEYWNDVNMVYKKFFKDHKPARAIIPSGKLHKGYLVELDAIAKMS